MMFVLAICLSVIVQAQNETGSFHLVDSVERTLETCTEIINSVDEFRHVYHNRDDLRRLSGAGNGVDDDQLAEAVENKLDVCTDIVNAVDDFRKEYHSIGEHEGHDEPETGPIVLNVGGTHFPTHRETLLTAGGSFFVKMLSNDSNFTVSPDGTYFIDRSPGTFTYILNYLRDGELFINSDDEYLRRHLLADAEYYGLPELKDYLNRMLIELTSSEVNWLNAQLNTVSRKLGNTLYRASLDGDSSSAFHSRCDNKGPTVVIVITEFGNVFGGFTYTSWSSSGGYTASTGSFLFRLRPSMGKYVMKSGRENYAVYLTASYGPTFGNGHDLNLKSGCMSSTSSYNNIGNTYDGSGHVLNNGVNAFKVRDYVVIAV